MVQNIHKYITNIYKRSIESAMRNRLMVEKSLIDSNPFPFPRPSQMREAINLRTDTGWLWVDPLGANEKGTAALIGWNRAWLHFASLNFTVKR